MSTVGLLFKSKHLGTVLFKFPHITKLPSNTFLTCWPFGVICIRIRLVNVRGWNKNCPSKFIEKFLSLFDAWCNNDWKFNQQVLVSDVITSHVNEFCVLLHFPVDFSTDFYSPVSHIKRCFNYWLHQAIRNLHTIYGSSLINTKVFAAFLAYCSASLACVSSGSSAAS